MITIPTRTDLPAYIETVQIDTLVFQFEFRWNERDAMWYMDIRTLTGEAIVEGTRIIPDWDLLGRYVDDRLPPGRFIALDTSGAGVPPGLNELGSRVVLIYATDAEIPALVAAA